MEADNKQELMNLATSHYNAGNYEAALETYKKALTIDHRNIRAKHGLARSLASLHKCREALEEFDWVLSYDGLSNDWYSELYKQKGDVYFELQISGSLRGKFWFYDEVLQNFLHALDGDHPDYCVTRSREKCPTELLRQAETIPFHHSVPNKEGALLVSGKKKPITPNAGYR